MVLMVALIGKCGFAIFYSARPDFTLHGIALVVVWWWHAEAWSARNSAQQVNANGSGFCIL
jgi:hypothetical protein